MAGWEAGDLVFVVFSVELQLELETEHLSLEILFHLLCKFSLFIAVTLRKRSDCQTLFLKPQTFFPNFTLSWQFCFLFL